jgi:transposase
LDLSAFHARYGGDGRRNQLFDPAMMVKVLVYGYATGVVSSRQIARRLVEDVAFRVLAAENTPAHRTLREFRQLHGTELTQLFMQLVRVAAEAGLVKLGRLGIDGTKLRANASKHKAMSYARMQTEEVRLKAEIAALLTQAEATDAREDRQFGKDATGDELPAELCRRETRLATIQAAKARLEARQRELDAAAGRHPDDSDPPVKKRGPKFKRPMGTPPDKAQDNFTAPESRFMKTSEGVQQCYNAQAAVDEGSQLIVAADLNACAADVGQLPPMVAQAQANLGQRHAVVRADAGYASEDNFEALEASKQTACVALGREGKQARAMTTEQSPATQRMAAHLATEQGQIDYRRRKVIPEPVFGWIKHVLGFRRVSRRGEKAAREEWSLMCLATNLRRMQRLGWKPT